MLPVLINPEVHGVWVKFRGTSRYGKICSKQQHIMYYPETQTFMDDPNRHEFWIMWLGGEKAKFSNTAGCVDAADLVLLPVEPEPWYPYWEAALKEAMIHVEQILGPPSQETTLELGLVTTI